MIRTFTFATIQYLTWADLPDNLRVGLTEATASGWYYVPAWDDSSTGSHTGVVSFDSSNATHRAARRLLDDSFPTYGSEAVLNTNTLVLYDEDGNVAVSEYYIHSSFDSNGVSSFNPFTFDDFEGDNEKSTIIFASDVKITGSSRSSTSVTPFFGDPYTRTQLTIRIQNADGLNFTLNVRDAANDYQFRVGDSIILDDEEFHSVYGVGNNLAPRFDADAYAFSLAENDDGSSTAIAIGTVTASDFEDDAITYSLSDAATAAGFAIDSSTGAISYTGTGYNYEALAGAREIVIEVTATSPIDDNSSGGETPTETEPVLLTDTVQVTIRIDDVAEPKTISATSSCTIAEDAAGGTKVADIIISGDEDSFTID